MTRKSTATKVKDLPNYYGDVAVYELSKAYKRDIKHVVLSKAKPFHGSNWINVWASDENGRISDNKPLVSLGNLTISAAFDKLGYKLNG